MLVRIIENTAIKLHTSGIILYTFGKDKVVIRSKHQDGTFENTISSFDKLVPI